MKKLGKKSKRIGMYNKVMLETERSVIVEYGKSCGGSSLHTDDKGCGTSFGGASCYPSGCLTVP